MTVTKAFTAMQKLSLTRNEETYPPLNEKQVFLSADQLLPAIEILQKNNIFHLSTITGVYQGQQLYLLYHFWQQEGITLRIPINQPANEVPTLTHLIPGALFYEREIAEMFAVHINGLDTSQKMFLPDNWEGGAPMRKDTPSTTDIEKSEHQ